jgi:ABC-type amino acid transport substrate-binding protein
MNAWGIALAPHNTELKIKIDQALAQIIKKKKLESIWTRNFDFQYPEKFFNSLF